MPANDRWDLIRHLNVKRIRDGAVHRPGCMWKLKVRILHRIRHWSVKNHGSSNSDSSAPAGRCSPILLSLPCAPDAFCIPFVPTRPSFFGYYFGLTSGNVSLSHLSCHISWVNSCFYSVYPGRYPNSPLNRPRTILQRPFKSVLHVVACCIAVHTEHEVATATMRRHCLAIGVLRCSCVVTEANGRYTHSCVF